MGSNAQQGHRRGNPLRSLWNALGTIGGVVTMSSMAESWLSDLFRWQGFIRTIVDGYRSLVQPIFEFLFGWILSPVPFWIGDYIVLGVLCTTSFHKAFMEQFIDEPMTFDDRLLVGGLAFLGVFLWPYIVFISLRPYLSRHPYDRMEDLRSLSRRTALWLAAIVLGLVVLLAINTRL